MNTKDYKNPCQRRAGREPERTMTVSELIGALSKFRGDLPVVTTGGWLTKVKLVRGAGYCDKDRTDEPMSVEIERMV
jgi:hypothetical protein